MRKRTLTVKKMSKGVRQMNRELCSYYGVAPQAERELTSLSKKVSPQLYDLIEQQLLGFHGDMQLEMAEDLVIFAYEHIAHTTGCGSVDIVLDICYMWIAGEHGLIKKKRVI